MSSNNYKKISDLTEDIADLLNKIRSEEFEDEISFYIQEDFELDDDDLPVGYRLIIKRFTGEENDR